ncbi:MAG: PAS domain-containing protein [Leptolyngbyaceae cyanobacterium bins.59]|nr:PAS domain-containing protein [Leptolyngbyaceae cyanobacterium bins.59]
MDHPPQQIISEPVDETASAIEGLLSRIHPHDRQTFQSSLLLAAQTLQPWVWEGQLVTPSGDIRSVRANFQPYPQKAGELVWQGDLADVTEQSDADEQDFVMEIAWRYMHYSHW